MSSDTTLLSETKLLAILGIAAVGVLGGPAVSPILPGLGAEFTLTETQIGLVMTAFFLPATLAIPVVGIIADIRGRRPIILASLLVFGTSGVAISLAGSFETVLLLRVIQGCAFPGLLPLSITVIGDLYEGSDATQAQGFRTSINGLVGVGAPLIAGVLTGISWRIAFGLYVLAFPVFLLCYLYLPESGAVDSDGDEDEDGISIPDRADISEAVTELADALDAVLSVLILTTIVVFFVRFALITFLPLYAVGVLGTSGVIGGVAVGLVGIGRFIAAPTADRVVTHFGRKTALYSGVVLFAVGTAALAGTETTILLLFAVSVASVGEGLFNPVANDTITRNAPTMVRGRVVSVLEVGKTGSVAISPVVFGLLLASTSYSIAFVVGGVLSLGMAFAIIRLRISDGVQMA